MFDALTYLRENRALDLPLAQRLGGKSWDATRKELDAHERAGDVRRRWLGRYKYWVLSQKRLVAWGLSRRRAKPFARDSLIRALARGWLTLHPGVGKVYSEAEFKKTFPHLERPGWGYLLDLTEKPPRLGILVVDTGTEERQLLRKVERVLVKRDAPDCSEFARAIASGECSVWLVTATPSKRDTLEDALAARPLPVPVHVVVIPQLEPLVCLDRRGK